MRRYRLQSIALVLMWIGALEIAASFLAKQWFQFETHLSPLFFLVLLIGIAMYAFSRLL
ncbi:hypothetical protein [Alicyclobacillus pomorum]|uniref:hypothetical protein n=1 Tax=Alicyclobacillus pomorum TaxID=204470 RepID=UPI00040EB165|nr:hypothetical protein [Alicyclobacillus pomorum]